MPIEKLEISHIDYKKGDNHEKVYLPSCNEIWICKKLNELIDFINTREQDRSEQMARMVDKIKNIESDLKSIFFDQITNGNELCNHTFRLNALEFKLENATHPNEEEICQINPCPWCGSYDIKFIDFGFNNPSFRGECMNCQSHNAPSKTKQEAIAAWNKRA